MASSRRLLYRYRLSGEKRDPLGSASSLRPSLRPSDQTGRCAHPSRLTCARASKAGTRRSGNGGEDVRRGHASSSTSGGARAGTERARPHQGRRSSTALRVTLTKNRNRARRDPPSAHSLPAQVQAVAFEASAPGTAAPHRDQTLRQREERDEMSLGRSGEVRKTEFPRAL